MALSVNIRTYRPQQLSVRESRRVVLRSRIALSREQRWLLTATAGVALAVGLAITQLLYGQVKEATERSQLLQARNSTVANENIRLLATRAQLASKAHILAVAERKLNLFEPDKGQVRRM
jgi:hypothetical protein